MSKDSFIAEVAKNLSFFNNKLQIRPYPRPIPKDPAPRAKKFPTIYIGVE
jgi:hypothetical protein